MATYFISDLHLESSRPEILNALASFLDEHHTQMSALYILGDLFEYWIGDDYETPLIQEVKKILLTVSEAGIKLFLMHGNRDFLIGKDFAKQIGCTLLNDPAIVDLYGAKVLLTHGDLLCTEDADYQQFRAMVHNPKWRQQLLAKTIDERLQIAMQLRSMSKSNGKELPIMDTYQPEVEKQMLASNVQMLIHGHTHHPAVHQMTLNNLPATRIVLGDWGKELWYCKVDEQGSSLEQKTIV